MVTSETDCKKPLLPAGCGREVASSAHAADICTRLALLIRALVADREAVSVVSIASAAALPQICIHVAEDDLWRVMGEGGRVAQSLRVLLDCIGERHGVEYLLSIDGTLFMPETQPHQASAAITRPIMTSERTTLHKQGQV